MDSVWKEMGVKDKGTEYKRVLSEFKYVKYAAFFDLIENSMLDILMVTEHPTEGLQIKAVFNNIDRTAFFLKARVLSDSVVSTVIQGASVRCVLTDINDHKFIVSGGAPAQTGFHSLAMSYTLLGIGRINNFVESFTVGMYIEGERVLRRWSPIIPKSILFMDANLSAKEENWNLSLLVKPDQKFPLILVCDGIFLLILGLIIIVLHMTEKAQDKREARELKVLEYF